MPSPFVKGHKGFKKADGTIGRPKGGLNKVTLEARKFFHNIFEDPAYRRSAIRRIFDGTAPHLETLGWHYFAGKPRERVTLEGSESFAALLKMAMTGKVPDMAEARKKDDDAA